MTRRRRLLLLQLVLWPALVVGAELGYRGWLRVAGEPYDPAATGAALVRIVSGMTRDVPDEGAGAPGTGQRVPTVLHPYVGFVPRTLPEKLQRELRRYATPSGDDEVRVLVLGGSVAGNFARKGTDALAALLAAEPALAGRRFTFVNYGLGAHKQPQQLLLASYLFSQGLEVDAVLNLDGFNEVALGTYNAEHAAHPSYPSLSHWGHLTADAKSDPEVRAFVETVRAAQDDAVAIAERDERWGLRRSALLGRWALAGARRAQGRYAEASAAYADYLAGRGAGAAGGLAFEAGRELEIAVDTWRRSSQLLHELCRARGVAYLHALQPTLHDEGAKPVTEEERAAGTADEAWIRGARTGYPHLRDAGRELAAEGVPFLDASRVFGEVTDTLYYDVCHFHAPGHVLLARAIAPALAPLLARSR